MKKDTGPNELTSADIELLGEILDKHFEGIRKDLQEIRESFRTIHQSLHGVTTRTEALSAGSYSPTKATRQFSRSGLAVKLGMLKPGRFYG